MADAPPGTAGSGTSDSKKRKRKEKLHIVHQTTFKKPQWSYFHLELITHGTAAPPVLAPLQFASIPPSASTASNPLPTPPSSTVKPAPADGDLDPLTVSSLIQPPLQTFLGLTGSAIAIDILKTQGREVWIRIAREDARAVRASLSAWVGSCDGDLVPGAEAGSSSSGRLKVAWRVRGESEMLGSLIGGDGQDLFKGR
jgi:ribonuclease P/MRP protein subunit POP8